MLTARQTSRVLDHLLKQVHNPRVDISKVEQGWTLTVDGQAAGIHPSFMVALARAEHLLDG